MFDSMLTIKLFLVFKSSTCSSLYIGKLAKKLNIVLEYGSLRSKEFNPKKYVNFFIVCYYFMCLILNILYVKQKKNEFYKLAS